MDSKDNERCGFPWIWHLRDDQVASYHLWCSTIHHPLHHLFLQHFLKKKRFKIIFKVRFWENNSKLTMYDIHKNQWWKSESGKKWVNFNKGKDYIVIQERLRHLQKYQEKHLLRGMFLTFVLIVIFILFVIRLIVRFIICCVLIVITIYVFNAERERVQAIKSISTWFVNSI